MAAAILPLGLRPPIVFPAGRRYDGYYLLSRVKPSDTDGIRRILSRLPGCDRLPDEQVEAILLEVARRGIPTIRGLSGNNTGATGDLGVFVAARMLQDRFPIGTSADSLTAVVSGTAEEPFVTLVVPVDPFRSHLDDLSRALSRDRTIDSSLARPDLLVVSVVSGQGGVSVKLTPVEVKCRLGSVFSTAEAKEPSAKRSLSRSYWKGCRARGAAFRHRRLAYQHLLLSIVAFGMRVYSQLWTSRAPRRIGPSCTSGRGRILADDSRVSVDPNGRLIVVDGLAHQRRASTGTRMASRRPS